MSDEIDNCLWRVRRRLVLRAFLNGLLLAWGMALFSSALWILSQPFLFDGVPDWSRWAIPVGLLSAGTAIALFRALRNAPGPQRTALLIDERFGLRERVTTALSLDASLKQTEPGRAILGDAARSLKGVKLAEQFPVRLDRRAWLLPIPAALALLAWFAGPLFPAAEAKAVETKSAEATAPEAWNKNPAAPPAKKRFSQPELALRPKSEKLEKLKEMANALDKLYANPEFQQKTMTPEKAREGIEKAGDLQEKMKQMEAEKHEQIKRMQEQLQKLTDRRDGELSDGPGKEAMQALRSGDFDKAKEEFDKLKKRIKNGELSEEQAKQLKRQVEQLAQKSDELAKKKGEQDKLKKLIDQAKKEGRNAESLERELNRMEAETKKLDGLKDMAKKLNEMKAAMDKNDLAEVAEKMGQLADQFGEMAEDVKDLEELDDGLEELKKFRKSLARKGKNGEGEGDEFEIQDDAEGPGRGMGRRKINEDAKSSSQEERVRVAFDPKGKKRYAGTTDGPAFTKKSLVELEGEIAEAAQDAADSADIQRLPKAARDSVKEYMERLGNQKK